MARTQGHMATKGQLRHMDQDELLQTILAPGALSKLHVYEQHRAGLESVAGVYIYDLEHNYGSGVSATQFWPSQLTHGRIVLSKRSGGSGQPVIKIATPMEYFSAMGYHMLNGSPGSRSKMLGIL